MDSDLFTLVSKTLALKETTRQGLLEHLSELDTEEEKKLRELILSAEDKMQQAQHSFDVQKQGIQTEYLKQAEQFIHHHLPEASRKIEEKDRSSENPEDLLSTL